MRNFDITLTAEPIFGRTLTLAECSAVLAKMSLGAVVGRLALFKHINEEVLCDPDASIETRKNHTMRISRRIRRESRYGVRSLDAVFIERFGRVGVEMGHATNLPVGVLKSIHTVAGRHPIEGDLWSA